MNRYLIFIPLILLISIPAHASESGFITGFIDWFTGSFNELSDFFTKSVPSMIQRALAYFIEWAVYLKFYLWLGTIKFAYGIAQNIANDLMVFQYLSTAVASLPPDLQFTLNSWNVPNCINLVVNAYITRFVLDFMGW